MTSKVILMWPLATSQWPPQEVKAGASPWPFLTLLRKYNTFF